MNCSKKLFKITIIVTVIMAALTPFIHHVVRGDQLIFGGECLLWMLPMGVYGIVGEVK